MEKLLKLYGGKPKSLKRGQEVVGVVIEKNPKSLVLDIGAKAEGIVAEKAFEEAKDYIKSLKVGDKVTAEVIVGENPEGYVILSLRKVAQEAAWKKLLEAKKKNKPVGVLVKAANPSGLLVEVAGLTGFIPGSQLSRSLSQNPAKLVGSVLKALIIELDREENKIVLSEREVSEEEDIKLIKEALEQIREGEIYSGKVTTITDFGCFVKISVKVGSQKVNLEGLVHISELSWEKVEKVSDVVSEGDRVKVSVIGKKQSKLALSIKQAEKDPWLEAEKRYQKETRLKGKVVKISDFGCFVQLEPGIEGLVHVTKIPPNMRLQLGQEVSDYIEEIDAKARKISLGLVLTEKPVGYK